MMKVTTIFVAFTRRKFCVTLPGKKDERSGIKWLLCQAWLYYRRRAWWDLSRCLRKHRSHTRAWMVVPWTWIMIWKRGVWNDLHEIYTKHFILNGIDSSKNEKKNKKKMKNHNSKQTRCFHPSGFPIHHLNPHVIDVQEPQAVGDCPWACRVNHRHVKVA